MIKRKTSRPEIVWDGNWGTIRLKGVVYVILAAGNWNNWRPCIWATGDGGGTVAVPIAAQGFYTVEEIVLGHYALLRESLP